MSEVRNGSDETQQVPRRPTMMDVARAAGVSQSSVSLVLNGMTGARISDSTRLRVVTTARDLGYILPFKRREKLPGRHGQTIAYVADEVSSTVFPVQNIDGARDAAWESGFLVSTHATRSNALLEAATIANVRRDPSLIGVIYATVFTREVTLPPDLDGIPVVLLNCYTKDRRHPSILPGETVGGFNATDHLVRHGHRRIGLINGEPWMDASAERLQGYRDALATADIPFDPELVHYGDWLPDSGRQHLRTLMAMPRRPSAIFCGNDLMAVGAMQAATETGLRIPDDLSIIGYDDQVIAAYTRPPLTTVTLPNYEMGRKAAEILIDLAIHGKQPPVARIKVDCPVVQRGSVGAVTRLAV